MSRGKKLPTKTRLAIPGEWSFRHAAVAADFDRHVREQLPWYDLATGIIAHLARSYVPEAGTVVDVGCSTGNVGRAVEPTLDARKARLIAIDSSEQMLRAYTGPGEPVLAAAQDFDFDAARPDLVVCFLSLMFVPIPQRRPLVERMLASLRPGGALVVFDKTVPRPGYLGTVAFRLTLTAKYENGAPADEIIAKELSLSGLQRPMGADELAGLTEVFRFGDFAGFVGERA